MPGHGDERIGGAAGAAGTSPRLRAAGLVAGFLLAAAATAVVLLTDDPQVLRLAVVGAAWAFVLAALLAARRAPAVADAAVDTWTAAEVAEREADLRLAYELELEREAAARREHELRVENDARRAAEESMRGELAALREQLAEVAGLRRDLAEGAGLRRDLAEVAGLRRDVAALAGLRADLAQLADLRADMGRLRAELTEQLSGEMLVERILLRTQSFRAPASAAAPPTRTLEGAAGWHLPAVVDPSGRTGTAAGDGTRQLEELRPEPARPPAQAAGTAAPPLPAERPVERAPVDATGQRPADAQPEARRRRTDVPAEPARDEQRTAERPMAQQERPPVPGGPPSSAASPSPASPSPASPSPASPSPAAPGPDASGRLAQILAENRAEPPSGGRRRRRYREDDETDDVLTRVLGGS